MAVPLNYLYLIHKAMGDGPSRASLLFNFQRYFAVSFIEQDYITFRLNHKGWTRFSSLYRSSFVQTLGAEIFRRWGDLVILARKQETFHRFAINASLKPSAIGASESAHLSVYQQALNRKVAHHVRD